jgi:vitamin B12 transporter
LDHRFSMTRTDTDNVNHTSAPIDDTTHGTKDTLNWQTNFTLDSHTLSLIAEHERNDYEQRGEVTFFGDPNKNIDTTTNSVATEYRYNGDLFDISASARRDVNSEFRNANTWRMTALWHATDHVDLFASTGKSVKNPTFTDRFGFYDTFIGNPGLKPEQSRAHEVGLRWRVPSANLHIATSYYRSTLRDEINGFAFDPATGSFSAENLPDESDRSGAELEFGWQPFAQLSVDGSYTWLDATENGLDEIRRAGNIGTLRLNYSFDRANINIGLNYNGSQWDNFFPPFPPFQERVHLSGYTLANVAGQYKLTEDITLTARIENLLDESYEEVFGFRGTDFAAYAGIRFSL